MLAAEVVGAHDRMRPLVAAMALAALYHALRAPRPGLAWGAATASGVAALAIGPAPPGALDAAAAALAFGTVAALSVGVILVAIARRDELLVAAVALSVLPQTHLVGGWINVLVTNAWSAPAWAGDVALVYAPLVALGAWLAMRARALGPLAAWATLAGAALGILLHAGAAAIRHGGAPLPPAAAAAIAGAAYPLRWIAFVALASAALLRDEPAPEPRRRLASRILVGSAFLAVGAVVVALARASVGGAWGALEWGALAALLVASQAFRRAIDRVGQALYRVAAPTALTGDPLQPGVLLAERYRVLRALGRGGQGRIVEARDERTGNLVAIKEVPRGAAPERRALARVASPRVVALLDVLDLGATDALVVEHAPGGSLAQRLRAGPPIATHEALSLMDDVLEGLAALHERGFVHGDVKPSNVLLDASGRAKLADLGSSRALADETAPLTTGTVARLAPELAAGGAPSVATDIFQAGLLLRDMGEGARPFEAISERATRATPAERFASARSMQAALQSAR